MAYRGAGMGGGGGYYGGGGDLDMLGAENESGLLETPLFSARQVDFSLIDPTSSVITHAQVANSVLYVFTQGLGNDRKLYRKTIGDASSADYFDLKVDPISKVFVNPLGNLILFTTDSMQTYYFSKNMKKYRNGQKFLKDVQIQCVAYNRMTCSENVTHFLVGSAKGEIISVEYVSGELTSAKQIHQLRPSSRSTETIPVLSMEMVLMGGVSSSDEVCVFCASKDRIYMFTGQTTPGVLDLGIATVIRPYWDGTRKTTPVIIPVPTNHSQIQVQFHNKSITPTKIYWFAGSGVLEFNMDNATSQQSSSSGSLSSSNVGGSDQMMKKYNVIPYPKHIHADVIATPKGCAVTEFHILLLYDEPRSVHALCPLNKKVMFSDSLPRLTPYSSSSSLFGLCKDSFKDEQYLITDKAIHKYFPLQEDRHIWRIHLENNNFDWALKFAGTDNPDRLNEIYLKKAEFYFLNGQFDDSADLYARTKASFEEIALKFIEIDRMSLKNYLCTKLSNLKSSEKAQITMLVMWIIQLYLSQIHLADKKDIISGVVEECRDEFHKFLREIKLKECLRTNMRVVYDLLGSHGDRESLTLVAEILNDYPSVVQNLVENEEYNEALDRLSQYKKDYLFYKYSSVLMHRNPVKTVDVWKRMYNLLQPKKLIPAIVQLDNNPKVAKQAISYLEFCLSDLRNTDTAIHNCLLTLYAMHEPRKLLDYLKTQNENNAFPYYDQEYALRICLKHTNTSAIIFLYKTMKLYEEAVDQALHSIDNKEEALVAAQEIASYAQEQHEEPQSIKKLWLKIGKYVVQDKKDVKSAMEFLRNNEHIKIEDILPFFPDFFTIDEFKEAILTSLHDYNDSIEGLKRQMENATESADKIRASIKENRSQCTVIRADEKCSLCGYPLLLRQFYSFPCRHAFHSDCLLHKLKTDLLSPREVADIERLQTEINSSEVVMQRNRLPDAKFMSGGGGDFGANGLGSAELEAKKEELDALVASECPFCGELMIQNIHRRFIPPERLEEELASWL
ncbi:vacuolar protein sorting-associated protein 18 homolog [Convolutriloba macropyga]|uniref:vacuolar protein sorting-associated protein 18 homolog n=1 Tax=Convolutriloba macropyga TaxID=536237 RepID=UPI003F525ADD